RLRRSVPTVADSAASCSAGSALTGVAPEKMLTVSRSARTAVPSAGGAVVWARSRRFLTEYTATPRRGGALDEGRSVWATVTRVLRPPPRRGGSGARRPAAARARGRIARAVSRRPRAPSRQRGGRHPGAPP